MRTPWSRPPAAPPAPEPQPRPRVAQYEEPEPPRVLRQPERPMSWVDPNWISPVVRRFFPYALFPRLSPYFEHAEYVIFVEARPYADLVERFPDEEPMYEAGNIWGMCYSAACLKGEEGHHHLSMLVPISPERWRRAQAAGWDL